MINVTTNERGVTLLELVVALGLVALLASLLLSLVRTTTRQVEHLNREAALDQALHATLEQLRADIRSLYWSTRDPRTGLIGGQQVIQGRRFDTLDYVALRYPWDGIRPGDARPMRVQYDTLDQHLRSTVTDFANSRPSGRPQPEILLNHLRELRLQFHNGEQWQNTWDTRIQQRLPVAIAVRLVAQHPDGPPHIAQTILVPTRTLTLNVSG